MRTKAEIIAEVVRSRREARAEWHAMIHALTRDNAVARAWRASRRRRTFWGAAGQFMVKASLGLFGGAKS